MSKYLLLVLFLLSGCHTEAEKKWIDKNIKDTGMAYMHIVCINGVKYYRGTRVLAPAFNQDGTLKLCNPNKEE